MKASLFLISFFSFILLVVPASSQERDPWGKPMPTDTLWDLKKGTNLPKSPMILKKSWGRSGVILYPYLNETYGLEQTQSGSEPFHRFGGGGGFRFHLDTTLAIGMDGFYLQEDPPAYWEHSLMAANTSPGFGKTMNKKVDRISGFVEFNPSPYFDIKAGQGKHFFGNGYRSLLLSHNADDSPYLRIDTDIWRIHYVNLYTAYRDRRNFAYSRSLEESKYATFHYLSIEVAERLDVGFFESVVWQGKDSMNARGYDVDYLNPVIFYRPVEYSQGSADNSLMGMDIAYRPFPDLKLYGQLVLDEFLLKEIRAQNGWWANKYGLQGGIHWTTPFGANGLELRAEANMVRPFTYSHASVHQNYAHSGQPLAHPLGANFKEIIGIAEYEKGRIYGRAEALWAKYGTDPNYSPTGFSQPLSYGRDLFKPYQWRAQDYGNIVGQGISNTLLWGGIDIGFVIDPFTGLRVEAGYKYRRHKVGRTGSTTHLYSLSLRTPLFPRYKDF